MSKTGARPRRARERAPRGRDPSSRRAGGDRRRRDPSSRELWLIAGLLALLGLIGRIAWYKHYNDAFFMRVGPDGMTNFQQAVGTMRDFYGVDGGEPAAAYARDYLPPGYPLFLATLWKLIPLHGVIGEREFWIAAVRAARVAQWLMAAGVTLMTFALGRRVLFGYSSLLPPLLVTASIAMIDVPNLLAAETLTAFLLTGAVLLLVKAREASAAAAARDEARRMREAAEAGAGVVTEVSGLEPPGGAFEDTLVHRDAAIDDFIAHDEIEDESRWSALDDAPPDERARDWTGLFVLLAGLSLSYAVLTYPRVVLLVPFAVVWALRGLSRGHAAVLLIVALLLPAGWIARNYGEHSRVLPLSISAQAALYEENVDPIGRDGAVRGASPLECPREMLSSPDEAVRQEWADCMGSAGIDELTSHPRDSLAAAGDRLAAMLSPWNADHARGPYASELFSYPEIVPRATREDPAYRTTRDWLNVLWIAIYAGLLIAGVPALWAEGPGSAARLMTLPLLSLPLALLVYHGENLGRLPLLPLIAISISLGMLSLGDRLRSRRSA